MVTNIPLRVLLVRLQLTLTETGKSSNTIQLSHNSIDVGSNHIVHLILLDFQVILGMEISK